MPPLNLQFLQEFCTVTAMLTLASRVLHNYGKVLAHLEPGSYGVPEAFLPHPKGTIREATVTAIKAVGQERPEVLEALIRGYVYLEQFVPDADMELLLQASEPSDPAFDPEVQMQVMRVANRIKLDMENALSEIKAIARLT
jgi:hypothetical protein